MGEFDFGGTSGSPAPLSTALREETQTYIDNTLMVDSPAEVNQGHCRVVADRAAKRATESPIVMILGWQGTGGKHYFLELEGRFYDAQRPDGVGSPSELPFFSGDGPYEIDTVRRY